MAPVPPPGFLSGGAADHRIAECHARSGAAVGADEDRRLIRDTGRRQQRSRGSAARSGTAEGCSGDVAQRIKIQLHHSGRAQSAGRSTEADPHVAAERADHRTAQNRPAQPQPEQPQDDEYTPPPPTPVEDNSASENQNVPATRRLSALVRSLPTRVRILSFPGKLRRMRAGNRNRPASRRPKQLLQELQRMQQQQQQYQQQLNPANRNPQQNFQPQQSGVTPAYLKCTAPAVATVFRPALSAIRYRARERRRAR